jgi:hypothetical protein
MFRRPTSTATALRVRRTGDDTARRDQDERAVPRARHSRQARRREAVDTAAMQARLDRVHRRLVEVGSVQVAARPQAIDNDAARRDPLTRPFSAPRPRRGTGPLPVPLGVIEHAG